MAEPSKIILDFFINNPDLFTSNEVTQDAYYQHFMPNTTVDSFDDIDGFEIMFGKN